MHNFGFSKFLERYSSSHNKNKCDGIICELAQTLKLAFSSSSPIRLDGLYKYLQFVNPKIVLGREEDAHEYFNLLLQYVDERYCLELSLANYTNSPVADEFFGVFGFTLTCPKHGNLPSRFDKVQGLILEIKNNATLEEALAEYFSTEEVTYKCNKCGFNVLCDKSMKFIKPPLTLIITLNRFGMDEEGGNFKIDKKIEFREIMNINNYVNAWDTSLHSKDTRDFTYNLSSVVTHTGSTIHTGHYEVMIKVNNGNFYLFNDASVTKISQETVLNSAAYILIYTIKDELENIPPLNIQQIYCNKRQAVSKL